MTENFSELTFEQIKINQTKEFQIKITESLVDEFAKLSGDFSPIHMDDEYAKSTKFKGRVVHGMLLGEQHIYKFVAYQQFLLGYQI